MTTPLWLDPPAPASPPLLGTQRCDVVVIGAGLCGSSAALALARQGVDTVLLDGGRVSGQASGRNAGFILQGTAERYDRAVATLGRDRARRIHQHSLDNHAAMAACIEEFGIACHYRRSGSLQLAGSTREEVELEESAALLEQDGFQARLLTGQDLPAVYREAGFRMGVLLPQDGELDPAALVRGLAHQAVRHGARLHEESPVLELDASTQGEARVRTSQGEIQADLVLVCVNARAGSLLPWFADKVDPVRGQMLATAPAPRIFELPVYADHGFDYWRQDHTNRVVLGGWRNLDPSAEVGVEDVLHEGIQQRMTDFIRRFPALADVPITHRWSGTMGFSRDGLPLVGAAPGTPAALVAVGFTGHGFGFAFLAGQALAQLALEGSHPLATELSPRRMAG